MNETSTDKTPADDARFECGCWLSEVGCIRYPAITGTMCCPAHLKPYGDNPERRSRVASTDKTPLNEPISSEAAVAFLVLASCRGLILYGDRHWFERRWW